MATNLLESVDVVDVSLLLGVMGLTLGYLWFSNSGKPGKPSPAASAFAGSGTGNAAGK